MSLSEFQKERWKRIKRAEKIVKWRPQKERRKEEYDKLIKNILKQLQLSPRIENRLYADVKRSFFDIYEKKWTKGKSIEKLIYSLFYAYLFKYYGEFISKINKEMGEMLFEQILKIQNEQHKQTIDDINLSIKQIRKAIRILEGFCCLVKIRGDFLFIIKKITDNLNEQNRLIAGFGYFSLYEIDSSIKNYNKRTFFKIFRTDSNSSLTREAMLKIPSIIASQAWRTLEKFIGSLSKSEINKKREGIYAAFCYKIACENYEKFTSERIDYPLPPFIKDISNYFKIGERTLKRRLKEIKTFS